MSLIDDDEREAVAHLMEPDNIIIKVATIKDLKKDKEALIAYRYLFWACSRNYIFIVHDILKNYGISPFLAEKEDKRSPFLAAIENNQLQVIDLLLKKSFTCASDAKCIARQKASTDLFGNNAMHKACRFRNSKMIEILL